MRANDVTPPTMVQALDIAEMFSISALLGITYKKSKALPNLFPKCLIPPMAEDKHMGAKLQEEAVRRGLKPAQIAEVFDVKPPSVYDWYAHGRIHQRHYEKLVEWSGKPITWWLDLPQDQHKVSEPEAVYIVRLDRHKELIALFEGLPKQEQDALMKTLVEKKRHYDAVFEDLLTRRNAPAQPN